MNENFQPVFLSFFCSFQSPVSQREGRLGVKDALALNCLCFAFMQHLEDTVPYSKYYQYSSSCNIEAEYM